MTAEDAERFGFGSRLGLDLTWTLRFRSVQPTELLVTGGDLRDWAQAAGLPVGGVPNDVELEAARELREAIYRAARCVIDGRRMSGTDLAVINDAAAVPVPVPRLLASGEAVLVGGEGSIAPALATVARDAIAVLGSPSGRLRLCADELCSLVFFDESRPGQRRWCSTARCGNRANTKAYRTRRAMPR